MAIKFECEHCRKEVKAPDEAGGRRGKCPFCGLSNYIPSPVSEDELLQLAPLDESEEQARQREVRALINQERNILAEIGGQPTPPLDQREEITAEELHHLVVNYCLDVFNGNLPRADLHVVELRKFGATGYQAVGDFQDGKAIEPALNVIPTRVLQGFLGQLRDRLREMEGE